MYTKEDIKKARDIAKIEHDGQMYGDKPYMSHVEDVVRIIKENNGSIEEIIVGYLHDVPEDTKFGLDQVEKEFGQRISTLVSFITDEEGVNRKEKKLKTNQKLSKLTEADYASLNVKLSDRESNVSKSIESNNSNKFSMYYKENDAFCEAIFRDGFNNKRVENLKKLFNENKHLLKKK